MRGLLRNSRPGATIVASALLAVAIVAISLAISESAFPLVWLLGPIALVAIAFGARGGLAAAAASAIAVVGVGLAADLDDIGPAAITCAAIFGGAGWLVGRLADDARRAAAEEREIERLSSSLTRLAGDLLHAENRERERIAQDLHDGALQTLLAANQDLIEANADRGEVTRTQEIVAGAIEGVRGAVADIHPATARFGGLEPALRAAAETAGKRAGFEFTIAVEYQAQGYHDDLLVAVGRELLANAAKHSRADSVVVSVFESDADVVMRVDDNGIGMPDYGPVLVTSEGHLGLASIAARVAAVGGSLDFESRGDRPGTIARVTLPKPERLNRM